MAYTVENFQTKKALKETVVGGAEVRCFQPGLGRDLTRFTGRVALEGPHYPQPHKWYANCDLVDGVVTKVR